MSNKTPKKLLDETESAPKPSRSSLYKRYVVILLFALVSLLLVYSSIKLLVVYLSAETLAAPDGTIQIEIADTVEKRRTGLSGRSGIDENSGMLFVFDNSVEKNCFWMKDMKFSIDMVWLNSDKEVVTVAENISPETYPESICPREEAKYGLELMAGNAARLGIVAGEELGF